MSNGHECSRDRRSALAAIVAVAALLLSAQAAHGAWAIPKPGSGAGKAKSVGAGNTPSVSTNGKRVSLSWTASSYVEGGTIATYVVRRYNALTGIGQPALNGCSGTLTALSCNENNVPAGSWQYTVTPTVANWRGQESPRSAIVVTT